MTSVPTLCTGEIGHYNYFITQDRVKNDEDDAFENSIMEEYKVASSHTNVDAPGRYYVIGGVVLQDII